MIAYDMLIHPKGCVSSGKRTQLAHRVGFDIGAWSLWGGFGRGRVWGWENGYGDPFIEISECVEVASRSGTEIAERAAVDCATS